MLFMTVNQAVNDDRINAVCKKIRIRMAADVPGTARY